MPNPNMVGVLKIAVAIIIRTIIHIRSILTLPLINYALSAHGRASVCGERGTMATTSIQTESTAETDHDQTEGCSTPQPPVSANVWFLIDAVIKRRR